MPNSLKNTEKEFKNLAGNLEVDIATDGLWSAIESELPFSKKKKKVILFWWVGMVTTGLFIFIAGYTFGWFEPYFGSKTDGILMATQTEKQITIHQNSTPLVENPKKINTPSKAVLNNESSGTLFLNQNIKKNNRRNTTNFHVKEVFPLHLKLHTKVNTETPYFSAIKTTKSITKELKTNGFSPKIPTLPANLLHLKQITPNLNKPFITPASKKMSWYIQFASGINQNWSQNELKSLNAEHDNRFTNEIDVYGVTSHVMFGLQKNNWSFALGLSHSMQATLYTQKETIITQQNITGIARTEISNSGIKTDFQGQVTETTVQPYDILWHRVHNGLDIQLEIGKTFYRKGRFSMNAYIGIGCNIWSDHTGYYFSEAKNSITKLENNTISPYKTKTGIKYNGAVSINYDWRKLNIGLSPFIKYSNTSVLKNSAFYTLKNAQYGLQVRMTIRP